MFTWLFASYAVVVAIEVRSVARLTAEDRRHTGLTCSVQFAYDGPLDPAEPEPDPDAIHDSGPADATAGVTINVSAAANPAATKRVSYFSQFIERIPTTSTYTTFVRTLQCNNGLQLNQSRSADNSNPFRTP